MTLAILPIGQLSLRARGNRSRRRPLLIPPKVGNTAAAVTLTPGSLFLFTAANWGAVNFFLEVYFRATSAKVFAQLFDTTSQAVVAASTITLDAAYAITRYRSGALALTDGHEYQAQFGNNGDQGAGAFISARIIAI